MATWLEYCICGEIVRHNGKEPVGGYDKPFPCPSCTVDSVDEDGLEEALWADDLRADDSVDDSLVDESLLEDLMELEWPLDWDIDETDLPTDEPDPVPAPKGRKRKW